MFLYNLITVIEVEEMFQQGLCLRCQSNLRMNTTHTVSIFRRSIHIQIEVVHVIYNCLRVHATLRVKCNMPFDSSLINTNISFAINPQYVDPHSFTVARILLMRLFIMPDVFVVVCCCLFLLFKNSWCIQCYTRCHTVGNNTFVRAFVSGKTDLELVWHHRTVLLHGRHM